MVVIALQGPILAGFLSLMGASEAVDRATRTYFGIRVLASPIQFMNYAILGWLLGLGRAGTGLAIQFVLAGVNVVLNILLVLVLDHGVAGVAWASVAAEATAFVVSVDTEWAVPPISSTRATVRRASAKSAITMAAPSRAKRTAQACPMPLAPPVMTATFPANRPPTRANPLGRARTAPSMLIGTSQFPIGHSQRDTMLYFDFNVLKFSIESRRPDQPLLSRTGCVARIPDLRHGR